MRPSTIQIELALSHVIDPVSQKNIIALGILEQIDIEENKVSLIICTETDYTFVQKNRLKQECISVIHEQVSDTLEIDVTFKKRKLPLDTEQKYHSIKNILAVASGKGGVGKSTVAANLAISLAKNGFKVGLFDADIYGPSIPVLFDVHSEDVESIERNEKLFLLPVEKHGVKLMSVGLFVEDKQALIWRGPMASNALKQLIVQTEWGELDYLILDLPPGTGDVQLTLVDLLPITAAIMVSTPRQVAIADVRRAFDMFKKEEHKIPVLGIVENMAFFIPEDDPNGRKYYLFGKKGCKVLSKELDTRILAEIPLNYSEEDENVLFTDSNKNPFGEKVFNQLAIIVNEEIGRLHTQR